MEPFSVERAVQLRTESHPQEDAGPIRMKIQILSDLHLSRGPPAIPQTAADLIVLAGDIGRPQDAIPWAARLGKLVLYVPGNHEFYGSTLERTARELREYSAGTCVRVLDDEAIVVGGVRFLGTTLWSDFRIAGDGAPRAAAMADATRACRDFSRIRMREDDDASFTPEAAAARFERHAAWLGARLQEPHGGPTVVITHHAPSPLSIHPRFAGSPLNPCFVSDATHLMGGDRVPLWIHGHTHDTFDYSVRGTRVVCNPRGYMTNGVNENASFDPGLTMDVH
jgi:predicted phosphodiesterase